MNRLFAMRTGLVLLVTGVRCSWAAPESLPASATTVYSCDFERNDSRGEWSKWITDVTPKGNRRFLGQFGTEEEVLTLKNLPAHKYIRVSFDLFLIRTWDGSTLTWGVSTWAASVVGGQVLLYTTFSNCGFFSDNNEQAFPDSFPTTTHAAWTGAAEKQSLGYIVSWGGPDRTFGCDSVYHIEMAFPHGAENLQLQFQAFKGEPIRTESWGLANVRAETLDAAPVRGLSADQLESLWSDLGGDDPIEACAAVWTLAGADEEAVAFLAKQMVSSRPTAETIQRLTHELGDGSPLVRDNASAQLRQLGVSVAGELRQALAETTAPATKRRLQELLSALRHGERNCVDRLRYERAFQALQIIGSEEALEILKTFGRAPQRIEDLKKEPALKPRPTYYFDDGL